jgi:hypothetical protein
VQRLAVFTGQVVDEPDHVVGQGGIVLDLAQQLLPGVAGADDQVALDSRVATFKEPDRRMRGERKPDQQPQPAHKQQAQDEIDGENRA